MPEVALRGFCPGVPAPAADLAYASARAVVATASRPAATGATESENADAPSIASELWSAPDLVSKLAVVCARPSFRATRWTRPHVLYILAEGSRDLQRPADGLRVPHPA